MSPTEVPPNFWTIKDILCFGQLILVLINNNEDDYEGRYFRNKNRICNYKKRGVKRLLYEDVKSPNNLLE
jgi:hypothetical protein